MILPTIISLLLYPGLLLALGLGVVYTVLTAGQLALPAPAAGAGLRSAEGLLNALAIVLASVGLALLPWPFHPLAPANAAWLWAWVALELAFLLPLLPALAAGSPLLARAAIREMQLGVVGRALLWTALAVGLVLRENWSVALLPAHLLALLAAVFALPAALGWGPFATETSVTPAGVDLGLDPPKVALAVFARNVRAAALMVTSLVALLPLGIIQPWVGLVLAAAAFGFVSLLLRRLAGVWARLPLPNALRLCWLRALPLGLAAVVYLAVMQ